MASPGQPHGLKRAQMRTDDPFTELEKCCPNKGMETEEEKLWVS